VVTSLGYTVAIVTYDPVEVLQRYSAKESIRFTLLSDRGSILIKAFGLLDNSIPATSKWHGFAHPVIFVVDPEGVVRHRFSEENYRQRPDANAVLDVLRKDAGRLRSGG